jgi:hypothetical protein
MARAHAFMRRYAVDLAFDGEQRIDALDSLGCHRRLKNLRRPWVQQAASMIGPQAL